MKLCSAFVHVYCLSDSEEDKIKAGRDLLLVVTIAPGTLPDM